MTQTNIRTINIRGKQYVDVAERVRLCNADEGFNMLAQERYSMGDRFFFSVTIEVKGKQYMGDAEIKFNAPKNTPDGTNPMECAQTSALGRALGFAGYGTVESIASADEVISAIAHQQAANDEMQESWTAARPQPKPQANDGDSVNEQMLTTIRNLCEKLKLSASDDVEKMTCGEARIYIKGLTDQLNAQIKARKAS